MSIDKLRAIVGSKKEVAVDKSDTFGQAQMNKSDQWISTNSNEEPNKKFAKWMEEFSDWGFTSNNTDYYWDTMQTLSPMNPNDFQEYTTEDIRSTIDRLPNLEEKENYFRDNASTWPSYTLENLGGYFSNIRGANAGKELERNRLGQVIEMKNLLDKNTYELNPNVSIEAHTAEMVKAYDMGYKDEIRVDNSGRLTIPLDGERVAVYTLPNPSLSVEEEFISLNDLRGVVKQRFKPMLDMTRKEQIRVEEKTKAALLGRIKKGEIPKEFRSNVIIDGVLREEDPVAAAKTVMLESINYKLEQGLYNSLSEMYSDYEGQYIDLFDKISRRLEDGKYS